jgi:hypothetical protein
MLLNHPSLVLVLCAVLGILAASSLIALGALLARFRSVPLRQTSRLVKDLSRQQRSIEALLTRIEVGQERGRQKSRAAVPRAATGPAVAAATTPRRADPAEATAVGGPTLIAVPSLSVSPSEAVLEAAAAAAELGRRFGAIWALADAGETPEAIGRATGQPIGQVELILGLRRQLAQAGLPGGQD